MSQDTINWEINGLTLCYDFEDVEMIERYEKAFDVMRESEKLIKKDGNISTMVENYCMIYWDLFDNLFGEHTAEKIFNSKKNARLCDETYESFIEYAKKEIAKNNQNRMDRLTRISGNREKRRNAEKQNHKK